MIRNMDAVIDKPDKFLQDKEITGMYKRFRGQIDRIKEEEEQAQILRTAIKKKTMRMNEARDI